MHLKLSEETRDLISILSGGGGGGWGEGHDGMGVGIW